ncbi:hypothetical protein [Streptomyces sp. NPDC002215]|uniref:hypothetical protein n=1 Tax=Streptomyces sp. NPDC002215 TaxID=3154412 RepID=UPI0033318268
MALSVRTVATRAWPNDGLEWMYLVGAWDEAHLEVALLPGGEEVWLRMSTDRSSVAVWSIEQWWDFASQRGAAEGLNRRRRTNGGGWRGSGGAGSLSNGR